MIYPGSVAQVQWGSGEWIFLDIGFSSKKKSCGLLVRNEDRPRCVTFASAKSEIEREVNKGNPLNLVIEAPLSVCFDSLGNPTGRQIEKKGGRTRYWYMGAGSAMMVASMYLLRELSKRETSIRLFEGFVSYKSQGPSDHEKDVRALQATARNPALGLIHGPNDLKRPDDKLSSAFIVAGFDCGVPAVIEPSRDCLESFDRDAVDAPPEE